MHTALAPHPYSCMHNHTHTHDHLHTHTLTITYTHTHTHTGTHTHTLTLTDPSLSGMSTTKTQEMLEGENDRMVEEMADKVQALKSLSIDIGDEVKGQNRFLGHMVRWGTCVCACSKPFTIMM